MGPRGMTKISKEDSTMRNFIICTVHQNSQGDQIQKIEMGRSIVRMEEGRSAIKILTGKPTRKRPLGRPRRR